MNKATMKNNEQFKNCIGAKAVHNSKVDYKRIILRSLNLANEEQLKKISYFVASYLN